MKEVQIELSVPTALSDITLGQYQKYLKVLEENEGADDFLALKTIEIFCKISLKGRIVYSCERRRKGVKHYHKSI